MSGSNALTDEQISTAKEILKKLPSKKQMNAQPESAMRLKTAFRKTKQKGYAPKEIRESMRQGEVAHSGIFCGNGSCQKTGQPAQRAPKTADAAETDGKQQPGGQEMKNNLSRRKTIPVEKTRPPAPEFPFPVLPCAVSALFPLPVNGSLMLWAGICPGKGKVMPPVWLLKMPAEILLFSLVIAAAYTAEFEAGTARKTNRNGENGRLFLPHACLAAASCLDWLSVDLLRAVIPCP